MQNKISFIFILALFITLFACEQAHAACTGSSPTWTTTPDQASVNTCIGNASSGDTVNVSAGSASWSGLSIAKAIHLNGAGTGQTNITLTGNNTITKQATGMTRVSGFSFSKTGGGNESKGITINGSWTVAEPVIIQNNNFTISNSGLLVLNVAGGVIISHNSFTGGWDDSFIQPKQSTDSENSWGLADTMGTQDETGKLNHYIEDNTFYGGTNQGIDCDDATRCVYRYNTLTYSSFNTHGKDSSPIGLRHFEVYNNTFLYPDLGGTAQINNQGWMVWIRGATGVIFNNNFAQFASSYWGSNKDPIRISIRGAEDIRPQGACASVTYPVPHQIGQNHNGTTYFTDPIYIWGNTGSNPTGLWDDWQWGNPCGFNWNDFCQSGRDYVIGTARPGYTPYTYPHPMVSGSGGGDTTPPTLAQVTAVPSVTRDTTPNYTFSSTEAGTISYTGDCSSTTTSATSSNNTVTFATLARGTHSNCTLRVTDAAANPSSALSINSFTVSYSSDLNQDRNVNVLDFGILHTHYSTTNSAGDVNYDGTVNILDFGVMHTDYGRSV